MTTHLALHNHELLQTEWNSLYNFVSDFFHLKMVWDTCMLYHTLVFIFKSVSSILFFFPQWVVFYCLNVCLLIHLMGEILVSSNLGLLWIKSPYTFCTNIIIDVFWVLLNKHLLVELCQKIGMLNFIGNFQRLFQCFFKDFSSEQYLISFIWNIHNM